MYDLPDVPATKRLIIPRLLTWAEVDPARHAFDPAQAPAVIQSLPPAAQVPLRPSGDDGDPDVLAWSNDVGHPWAEAMSQALVNHYGRWACGWRWGWGESDLDGGPISTWCCPRDSMSTPDATLTVVSTALLEWRSWLEYLGEQFDRFLPLPPEATDAVVLDVWEHAVAHLVTEVVEQTGADSGWYTHCQQVLGWFLSAAGIPTPQHDQFINDAIGGRFHSWTEPEPPLVADVAQRLAETIQRNSDA